MQEEPDPDIVLAQRTQLLAENLRKKHEVIIVDPDQVSVPGLIGDGLSEQMISLPIGIPGGFVKDDFTGMVVQEWPQD